MPHRMSAVPLNLPQGVVAIVRADEVSGYSSRGYRLIAVVTDAEPVAKSVQARDQYGGIQYNTEYELGSVSRYVMQLDEASSLAKAAERIAVLEADAATLTEQRDKSDKALTVALKNTSELEETCRNCTEDLTDARDFNNKLRDTKQRLEADIGKIRGAVGAIKMKEILGTED